MHYLGFGCGLANSAADMFVLVGGIVFVEPNVDDDDDGVDDDDGAADDNDTGN